MRYLLAILFPPLAVLLCGKMFNFFVNIPLTIFGWVPGIVHALVVVAGTKAEEHQEKVTGKKRYRSFRLSA